MTERLYYKDSHMRNFTCRVLSCREHNNMWISVLDRTAFFPEGGGQAADTGKIGAVRVLDVQEKDGEILHCTDVPLDAGAEYQCSVDWPERFRRMQNHSGEHIVSGLAHSMVCETIRQFQRMFAADTKLNNGKRNELWYKTIAHDETVAGAVFYPWRDEFDDVPLQMIPYFVTCHVNSHTVLNYIDAMQSIGLPGDPCPMCQAESGIFVLDDYPDYSPVLVTSNEACDGSVGTSIITDWFWNKPLFAMPQPMSCL